MAVVIVSFTASMGFVLRNSCFGGWHSRCALKKFSLFAVALDTYTRYGYIATMQKDTKNSCATRLNRIEGQVRGLSIMIEGDRYCIDVVNQVRAVVAALKKVEREVLADHISHCVEEAIRSGSQAEQRKKVAELVTVMSLSRG